MYISLIGYLFCLVLGIWGFAVAGGQVIHGGMVVSLDNLFLTMFAGMIGVACFSYLAWRFLPVITAPAGAAAGKGGVTVQPYAVPEDPEYTDAHIPLFNKIWIGLLVLTAVEVILAYVQLTGILVMLAILLVLSALKAGMILSYFMHLKFDHPQLSWTLLLPAVACILAMCGYFFPDSFRLLELRP